MYELIPEAKCPQGCASCCGPVPVCEEERVALGLPEGLYHTRWDPQTFACEFLVDGRCSVYEKRPFICRMFWQCAVGEFRCHYRLEAGFKPTLDSDYAGYMLEDYFCTLVHDGTSMSAGSGFFGCEAAMRQREMMEGLRRRPEGAPAAKGEQ